MKIAVIGIGNILLGDEGVGVRIVEELRKRDLPENVEVHDGATSGIALLNFLVDKDKVIIVDAVKGGEEPGTVYQFSINEALERSEMVSLHDIDFVMAYQTSKEIMELTDNITVIGIEPKVIDNGLELSKEVEKAIPHVIELVHLNLT
ncbi:MAG: hydrogenase maturation protease [Archaeoglobaceae archaeon]